MILPIKPVCKKEWIRRDGTSIIFLQYCYAGNERVLVDSGIAIPPEYWNRKTSRINSTLPQIYGSARELEIHLSEKLHRAEDLVNYALTKSKVHPAKFLKQQFATGFNPKQTSVVLAPTETMDVFWHIDDYARSKEGCVKRCTLNVINEMKAHLLSFQTYRNRKITFDCFDHDFYEAYFHYLVYEIPHQRRATLVKGLKLNTVSKSIKYLKAFLKNRMKKKIIPFMELSDYKSPSEEVDAVYLNWQEVSTIYHLDLSEHKHLEKYRDLLVLGCLTGFRFSDYSDIRPEEVRDGMLYINQQKTSNSVIVPLRKDARAILIEKYHMQMPQVSNPNFNEYIKEVCKLAGITEQVKLTHRRRNDVSEEVRPKYAWVTSHTCRRSFCTNEYLAGTPTDLIMAVSGHKTEKAFRRYIKADKVQKAYMIKKIWDSRPSL